MSIPFYQVDAFTADPFRGNPAGVCHLQTRPSEQWMQSVAMEMNLSETAFTIPRADGAFDLRWFTPRTELDLCGHATLAASHVLWETGHCVPDGLIRYHTRSGRLHARRQDGLIELDFPATPPEPCKAPDGLLRALGLASAIAVERTRFHYLVEAANEEIVRSLAPDVTAMGPLDIRGVIVTARSSNARRDFVSRFLAPAVGVDEDPVTSSAHCALALYWAHRLGKTEMDAYQASSRGGSVHVRLAGDRVFLGGSAVTVLSGTLLA